MNDGCPNGIEGKHVWHVKKINNPDKYFEQCLNCPEQRVKEWNTPNYWNGMMIPKGMLYG